jgi:GNAT superfamily N-acetyltransferase
MPVIACREVDTSNWPDLVHLFEARGGPSYCWCLVWRERYKTRESLDLPGRRALMERRVSDGTPVGLLAYVDGEPAGWCSVAPRETYLPLGGGPYPDLNVWSIVCFYVPRRLRRQGISTALLDAAVGHATAAGADVVEAYPVAPDSPSYGFMGRCSTFLAAGFLETGMAGSRRHVMRLLVTGKHRATTNEG